MTDRFEVLVVCYANLCRSPLVERLTRKAFSDWAGFEVRSAGVAAVPGMPMHPYAEAVLRECGAADAGFLTRALSAELLTRADLVLTASREQRAWCVSLASAAVRYTFTMRQFGRLASTVEPGSLPDAPPVARAHALVEEVARARGEHQPVAAEDDDLADPVGRPVELFRACARQIQSEFVDVVTTLLTPPTPTPAP